RQNFWNDLPSIDDDRYHQCNEQLVMNRIQNELVDVEIDRSADELTAVDASTNPKQKKRDSKDETRKAQQDLHLRMQKEDEKRQKEEQKRQKELARRAKELEDEQRKEEQK